MEPRTLVFALVAVVVIGAGGIFINAFSVESTKNELRLARAQLTSERNALLAAKESISLDESKMRDLNNRRGEADGSNNSTAEMEEEIAKMQKGMEVAKNKWAAQVELMEAAIQQVRAAAKDTVLAEIPMRVGAPLKACTIHGFKDNMLSIIHGTGTARLTAEQLPPDLADRLRIGWNPVLQIPGDETVAANGRSEPRPDIAEPIPETPAFTEVVPPTTRSNASVFQIEQKQKAIEALYVKIQFASDESARQQTIASEARQKYARARYLGRSSSQSAIADRAMETIETLQKQIRDSQAQISRIQREISEIR